MKIFIAGPRAVTSLGKPFEDRLLRIYEKNYTVLVGDAVGVDKAVQKFFSNLNYPDVVVYASNGIVRTNIGKWPIESVRVPDNVKGFEFYAAKDRAMAYGADYGFMLWNGESKGTLNNIVNLLNMNKDILVFFAPKNTFVNIDCFEKLEMIIHFCSNGVKKIFNSLYNKHDYIQSQLSFFEDNDIV